MTIVFTGGGTGGHFYPIIAIAEGIRDLVRERRLLPPHLYYLAPEPFDRESLFENEITFIPIPAGKVRRYASIQNFFDLFVTGIGIVAALITLFRLYPDVVVSKGGYASVPAVLAARFLRIPVVIHESDAKPGRANLMASRFAKRIAIAFESAADFFPPATRSKIARTGTPIRQALTHLESEGARQYLNLESGIPTVLILGGSQGSRRINDTVLSSLSELVALANVIHQTGTKLFKEVEGTAKVALAGAAHADRYHPFNYLSTLALQRAAGVADLVVSRAGAGAIAEIAVWGKPSLLIPIPEPISHDQRANAYAFARTGATIVIEEGNLTPHLFVSEIRRVVLNPELSRRMGEAGKSFTDPDAGRVLAIEILDLALVHES